MPEERTLSEHGTAHELNAEQAGIVRAELARVVAHPVFKGSKRSIDLLRYLVEQALRGEHEPVKERTVGIEVFGREATYDTNADPIVRRTANEIRKRLALCYLESDRKPGVQIHMERGSYRVLLEFPGEMEEAVHEALAWAQRVGPENVGPSLPLPTTVAVEEPASFSETIPGSETRGRRRAMVGAIALGVLAMVAALVFWLWPARSPDRELWSPLVASHSEVTICLSDLTPFVEPAPVAHAVPESTSGTYAAGQDLSRFSSDTPFSDVSVAHGISNRLSSVYKVETRLQRCSALKLDDFKRGPTVLIGGTNNPWVLLFLSQISGARYSIQQDAATHAVWIKDTAKPEDRTWRSDGRPHDDGLTTDYGLITRFFDQQSGQWVLAVSGLGAHGTEAAGMLIDNAASARLLPSTLRGKGNVQVVVQAPVIRGATGTVKVISLYTW